MGIYDHDEAQGIASAKETQGWEAVGGRDRDKKMGKKPKVMGVVGLKEHLAGW